MTDAIDKSVTVPLAPEAAFRLFTEKLATWWPGVSAQHTDVMLEPGVDGRVIEHRSDGRQVDLARISHWAPGKAVSFDWYAHPGQSGITQVQVTFTGTEAGTIVRLVHSGFDQLAPQAPHMAANQNGPAWAPGRQDLRRTPVLRNTRRARPDYSARQPVSASAKDCKSAG